MYNLLIASICEKVSLTNDEKEIIKKCFVPKKVRKRQFLLTEGAMCDRFTFVSSGALASYTVDQKGNDHVISFAFEGAWTGDMVSLFDREPSRLNIEALEDCELLQMRAGYQDELIRSVPAYERFIRICYQDACVVFQRRIESCIGINAEEKYESVMNQFPFLAQRAPLNRIASYLGVAPATLSRIRKQKYDCTLIGSNKFKMNRAV